MALSINQKKFPAVNVITHEITAQYATKAGMVINTVDVESLNGESLKEVAQDVEYTLVKQGVIAHKSTQVHEIKTNANGNVEVLITAKSASDKRTKIDIRIFAAKEKLAQSTQKEAKTMQISAHSLAQAVNKEYGNIYAWVINERTIGLSGGTVINIIGYLGGEKCALEAWNMNSGNIWNKGFDTIADATFEDAVDYIASRVLVTKI